MPRESLAAAPLFPLSLSSLPFLSVSFSPSDVLSFSLTFGPSDCSSARPQVHTIGKCCWLLMGQMASQRCVIQLCLPSGVPILDQRLSTFSCCKPMAVTLEEGCPPLRGKCIFGAMAVPPPLLVL